jgi:site-specific recombinase XerD
LTSSRVRCHALRHVYCSRLLNAGVPINIVRDLMGHASLTSTNEYAHSSVERLREAIDLPYTNGK